MQPPCHYGHKPVFLYLLGYYDKPKRVKLPIPLSYLVLDFALKFSTNLVNVKGPHLMLNN